MKYFLVLSIICLLVSCGYKRIDADGAYVSKYQEGHITYLIFRTSGNNDAGIDVRNYTQDSLDYEFMKFGAKPGGIDDQVLVRIGDTTYTWVSRDQLKTYQWKSETIVFY